MSSGGVGTAEPVSDEPKAPSSPANDVKDGAEAPPAGEEDPGKDQKADEGMNSPPPQSQPVFNQQTAYHPHLTPGAGYYSGYPPASQMTPEPPSPAGPGGTGVYDVASFLQQQAALAQQSGIGSNPFGANVHYGIPQPPLSPSNTGRSMGAIPPASPLFPRAASNAAELPPSALEQQHDSSLPRMAPPSPSVYMSPPLGPSGMSNYNATYSYGGGYGNVNGAGGNSNNSPEETNATWAERTQQSNVQASPQMQQQGVPVQYAGGMTRGNRTYSFDEMLPPSILDHQDQQSPLTYSPYGATQTVSSGTLFAHQPWGYSPTSDLYAVPGSPLQPRPNPSLGGHFHGGHAGMRQVFPGQQPNMPPYYPASSPGPPIQTTVSNKGPDGSNLFIFHIPNHFTNLDMYHLFCQYGNLLSVRIMVEKDTGRSRGFGFVSYDSPESASMAIKELNGFAIGNKRLKVQHKQNRAQDRHPEHSASQDSLPPSNRWYERPAAQATQDALEHPVDDSGGQVLGSPDENQTSAAPGSEDPTNAGVDHGSGGVDLNVAAPGTATLSPLGNLDQMRNALPDVSE